ncbi:MAG: 1-acyl-sn-glycerol-3-phosphate acyltransferase [Actinotalea sp.]|nr:1-acyl-sn-glycerol-3-phosphate acyltransferase [Actinotalea sp.]
MQQQRRRRVGTPPGFTYTGAARKTFWRWFFQAVGGFKVTGSAPYEAMVVVANHSSHADTPALIAAFPTPYKPMVVAAEDYWFSTRWRKAVVKMAIGAVPVRRKGGGGYDSLVEGAQQVLGQGSSLLVFPEGTRSKDGRLQTFRKGALRMAKEFDVPILPVAVVGTHELLPKGGRFRPGPVEVRLGRAIQPEDLRDSMDPVKEQIQELLDMGPASYKPSPPWRVFRRAMNGRAGMAGAAAWGFAGATVLPLPGEVYLAAVGAANPPRVVASARWLAVGSVAGALVNRALARRGVRLPTLLAPAPMHRAAHERLAAGPLGAWREAADAIPLKVYAQAAADLDVPVVPFALHTGGARAARALAVGAAVAGAAKVTQPMLRRGYEPYLGMLAATVVGGLALVVRRWARR